MIFAFFGGNLLPCNYLFVIPLNEIIIYMNDIIKKELLEYKFYTSRIFITSQESSKFHSLFK